MRVEFRVCLRTQVDLGLVFEQWVGLGNLIRPGFLSLIDEPSDACWSLLRDHKFMMIIRRNVVTIIRSITITPTGSKHGGGGLMASS